MLRESNRKPNKVWVDKGSKCFNRSMKSWLEKSDIEMYSTHNEGKYAAAERSFRTLKNKINKYMSSISKNVYIDELDDIVNKYNNICHNPIKMKPADVKSNTCIDSSKETVIVKEKRWLERFTKKNCKKQIKKSLEL